ncbi:4Fe-4S single cluster protein [Micromonospora sp. Llam0]|uniref:radical SAM/SPASM domain-containing protein n=1 Tax=Micromonospora sp. Llam0 TaxID=2485143 RepID=UPI000F484C23|nr:radical SAM protein [Micromonospora sp. Llam0]ROO62697.1 4Fe-4S single cluster protein [Micromonospora sp. Llam0]
MVDLSFVWLEITGRCQLECRHCYAASGPSGGHGSMTAVDWRRVIDQAVELGVEMVQFIGGEPTLHPDLPDLLRHALAAGLEVEVFSNLVYVTPAMWELFAQQGVRLACSYYSDQAGQHAAVTGRAGSHARTRANIGEAVRRSIPLRVGVVDLGGGQRVEAAVAELRGLGATEVGVDRLRQVGRGVGGDALGVEQLCGNCASGVLAVGADGAVWPCVFSRWLPVGNVREANLASILTGQGTAQVRAELRSAFGKRPKPCGPQCAPARCQPTCSPSCSPSCNPCAPAKRCWPYYR